MEKKNNSLMNDFGNRTDIMSTKFLSRVAILACISTAVSMISVNVGFAPSFYKLEISDSIILMGGFILGPTAVAYMQLIKILLSFLISGTSTGGVGEISSFLMGISFSMPAVIIYQRKKDIKFAVLGSIVGIIALAIVGALLNMNFLIPAYSKSFSLPLDVIIGMGTALNDKITNLNEFILYATVPFNIFKGAINSIIAIAFYKLLDKFINNDRSNKNDLK